MFPTELCVGGVGMPLHKSGGGDRLPSWQSGPNSLPSVSVMLRRGNNDGLGEMTVAVLVEQGRQIPYRE